MKTKTTILIIGISFVICMAGLIGYGNGIGVSEDSYRTGYSAGWKACDKKWQHQVAGQVIDSAPLNRIDLDESDKAMMEVIKQIAEIESANITIDTPEGHFHFEWQR